MFVIAVKGDQRVIECVPRDYVGQVYVYYLRHGWQVEVSALQPAQEVQDHA
jgi:hypothetical protein